MRGVKGTEAANDADCKFSDLKDFIVQCNEQCSKVLGLRKMWIKLFIQRHKHGETDFRL